MLVIWLFVRNRGAWKETDLDHGIQPPSLQEASRRQVHLERVSNIVPQPREALADGGEAGGDVLTTGGAQEDWRRSESFRLDASTFVSFASAEPISRLQPFLLDPATTLNRDGPPHIPAPAYVVPPVPPPAYTASES